MSEREKPRLLILSNFLSVHGGTRSVAEDLADQFEQRGYRVLRSSSKRNKVARLLDRVGTILRRRGEYDVACADVYSGPAFVWAEAACCALRLAGRPCIMTLHGGNLPRFAQRWPRRVRRLLASARSVTAPSKYLFEQMRTYRQDLVLLPNALDLSRYPFAPRSSAAPRLVWLRAFDETYNPSMAVRVLAILSKEFADVRLTMFGPDKGDGSVARCRATAHELGVSERVTMPGGVPKSEVPAALQQGDIFLNTTNVDNAPVSVVEAMACGLCVVSTRVGGIPYLLDDEQDSLLVPAGDPEAMACAVRRILADPSLAARLSQNARRKATAFDWPPVLAQWERLVAEVASGATSWTSSDLSTSRSRPV